MLVSANCNVNRLYVYICARPLEPPPHPSRSSEHKLCATEHVPADYLTHGRVCLSVAISFSPSPFPSPQDALLSKKIIIVFSFIGQERIPAKPRNNSLVNTRYGSLWEVAVPQNHLFWDAEALVCCSLSFHRVPDTHTHTHTHTRTVQPGERR